MAAGCHAPLHSLGLGYVDYVIEEVGFAMLATKILLCGRRENVRGKVNFSLSEDEIAVSIWMGGGGG